MTKTEELNKLDEAIKNAELSQKSIQNNIEQLSKEINALNSLKFDLEQNLQFHKRVGVIPIAHEYGKTKSELIKVVNRLHTILLEHKKSVKALNDVKEIIEKFKRDYAELAYSKENNVVRALFGARRGKK